MNTNNESNERVNAFTKAANSIYIKPAESGWLPNAISAATSRENEKPTAVGEQAGGELAAAPCSAGDAARPEQGDENLPFNWKGTFFENAPLECFTSEGKLKWKVNQNCPTIVSDTDGRLVQLSPDNCNRILPQLEVEFYQGEAVSPETVRQLYEVARMNHHPSVEH